MERDVVALKIKIKIPIPNLNSPLPRQAGIYEGQREFKFKIDKTERVRLSFNPIYPNVAKTGGLQNLCFALLFMQWDLHNKQTYTEDKSWRLNTSFWRSNRLWPP